MLIPAAAITVALTAGYGANATSSIARAALAGVAPVTAGMTLAMALLLIRSSARRGRAHAAVDVSVTIAALAASAFFAVSAVVAIAAGAVIGAVALGRERPTSRDTQVG